jgi:type I restriction enzyme S subunit
VRWPIVKLDSLVVETRNGLYKHNDFYGQGTQILKMFNLQDGRLSLARVDRVEIDDAEKAAYGLRQGDILLNRVNTPDLVGKCAVIPRSLGEAVFESKNIRLRLRQDVVDPYFIARFLNSPAGRASLCCGVKHAIGMATINNGDVRGTEVPLPALKEQQRIGEVLEQADTLRQERKEANALAERILPAFFCHLFSESAANRKSWPRSPLSTLVDFVSGATPSKEVPEYWGGGIPWISPKDMKQLELYDAQDHVTEKALAETGLKRIAAGVPLIVVRGMILAHTVPICLTRVPVTINQDMKALQPKGRVTGEYLQWALITRHRDLLRVVSTAAHGTRKLDTEALRELEIPMPPQNRSGLIERWSDIVHAYQNAAHGRAACEQEIGKIWQVMLHRAFTGELTAKWRQAHMRELLAEMEHQVRLLSVQAEEVALG